MPFPHYRRPTPPATWTRPPKPRPIGAGKYVSASSMARRRLPLYPRASMYASFSSLRTVCRSPRSIASSS